MDPQSQLTQEQHELVERIAAQLGESYPFPIRCISNIVELCGEKFAEETLEETLKVESEGGMMLPNRRRRRTPGGVYFYLVRQKVDEALQQKIFEPEERPYWRPPGNARPLEEGEARLVELTIKGRPGNIEEQEELVTVHMAHKLDVLPNLPSGVPKPADTTITYKVYIASKQWQIIQEFMHVPEDELIVTGLYGRDPEGEGMALFAMSVSTRQREWMIRKYKEQDGDPMPSQNQPKKPKGKGSGKPAGKKPKAKQGAPNSAESSAPKSASKKIDDLRAAVELYRQKISDLESKPANQQAALPMTRKLLQNAEAQLKALEAKQDKSEG